MPEALLVAAIHWLSAGPLLVTSAAIMGSPGPATISLTAAGSAYGVRRSFAYLAGIIVGTTIILVAVATGMTATAPGGPCSEGLPDRDLGGVHPLARLPHRNRAPARSPRGGQKCALALRRNAARSQAPAFRLAGSKIRRPVDPDEGHDEDLSQRGRARPSIANARMDKFRGDPSEFALVG